MLASVALASFMAACSQEELVEVNPGVAPQGDRPTAKVELAFDEGSVTMGSANSRLEWGNGGSGYEWLFKDGDRIGALLMDEWNQQDCGIQNFNFTDYVHTNYAFIRKTEGGKTTWQTPEQAPVCEGNYFFYFPYNPNFNHRGHAAWSVQTEQKNYRVENGVEKWDPFKAVEDNQRWLGYSWVGDEAKGAVNKVNFSFVPLFSMPKFVVENNTGMKLQIEKMVVRTSSNETNDKVDIYGQSDLMATTMILAPKSGEFGDVNQTWTSLSFDEKTAQMWTHAQRYSDYSHFGQRYQWPVADAYGKDMVWETKGKPVFDLTTTEQMSHENAQAPTYTYTVDFGKNYYVPSGEDIKAMLVMPAGVYENVKEGGNKQTFEVILYVNTVSENGVKKAKVARIDFGAAQTNGGLEDSHYDDVLTNKAGKFLPAGKSPKFQGAIDATALQSYTTTDWKVSSSSELLSFINRQSNLTSPKKVLVQTMGNQVRLTSEIEKALDKNPNLQLMVNGQITIANDCSENAINRLFFNPGYANDVAEQIHVISEVTITNKQVKAPERVVNDGTTGEMAATTWTNCVLNIAKGGELNTVANGISLETAAIYIAEGGKLNAGDITIQDLNHAGDAALNVAGDMIENFGTLTVNNLTGVNVNASGVVLENSGDATVAATTTGDIWNKGTMVVSTVDGTIKNFADAKATLNGQTYNVVDNMGYILVKETSIFNGTVSNNGTLDVDSSIVLNEAFENRGVANVNTGVTSIKEASHNYGLISIAAGAEIDSRDDYNKVLMNMPEAVINVEGKLLDKAQNSGVINCINHGQVIVYGSVYGEKAGIIDVTKADGTDPDQSAKDYVYDGNMMNSFRYTVNAETTATALDASLKARISSHNYGRNPIIVIWGAESPAKFQGTVSSNVERVVVLNKVVFGQDTKFSALNNVDMTQSTNREFVIAKDATVTVENYGKLTLGNKVYGQQINALVNGTLKVNNQAEVNTVAPSAVIVEGNGHVQNESGSFNFWYKSTSFAGDWDV